MKRFNRQGVGGWFIVIVKNMFRLTSRVFQKSLRAKRSNLSGFPKDCFVAKLLAMTDYRNKFLTTALAGETVVRISG